MNAAAARGAFRDALRLRNHNSTSLDDGDHSFSYENPPAKERRVGDAPLGSFQQTRNGNRGRGQRLLSHHL